MVVTDAHDGHEQGVSVRLRAACSKEECVRTRQELLFFLTADLAAHHLRTWRWYYRWTKRIPYFQRLLRHGEYWEHQRGPRAVVFAGLLRWRLHVLGEQLGYTVPRHVAGPGLSLAHKGTVVINEGASIGRNARLHHGVTIGQIGEGFPRLGDNVWVAAGAQILGGVTVGDGAAVGANAVVISDVPAGVTVGGVPAKVISERSSERWLVDACGRAESALRGARS